MKLARTFSLALSLVGSAVFAQPSPPAVFEISTGGSLTGKGDTDYAGATHGSVELRTARASVLYRGTFTDTLGYRLGAGFAHAELDAPTGVPLPQRLQSVYAEIGASWTIDRNWTLLASAQPGRYSDTEASGSDAFSAPATLLAQWRGPGAWSFGGGVRYHSLARSRLMPAAYARWQPSAAWTVSLGAPRTEVAWQCRPATAFFTGASFEGGSFAVDDPAVRPPAGFPSLRDTKFDYREIRLGAGVRHQITRQLRLQLEAGAAASRRFEYFDRSLKIEAASAAFAALSLTASF